MRFTFRTHTSVVDNRRYRHSSLTRMCESLDLELAIPFTDKHLLVDITCSVFRWLAKPDAWRIRTGDGLPTPEKVFPYAEWVACPECGDDVVNDDLRDHIEVRHNGEYKRFFVDRTRDEYKEW